MRNRLALVNTEDLRFGRDGIADEHRRRKLPVLAEKNRARPWHLHGYQCVQQSRRQAALDHQTPEFGPRRKLLVEM